MMNHLYSILIMKFSESLELILDLKKIIFKYEAGRMIITL